MFEKKYFGYWKKGFKGMAFIASVTVLSFALSYFALAAVWTGPSNNPPNPNVDPPLNVGSVGQSKAGGLILNTGGAPLGLIVQKGDVGIGTAAPAAKLEVAGNVIFSGIDEGHENGFFMPNGDITVDGGTDGIFGFHHRGNGAGQINFGNPYWPPVTPGLWAMSINVKTGRVGVGTTDPGAKLEVQSPDGYDQFRIYTPYTPSGTGDANGATGNISWDDNYLYVKTFSGWKRTSLSIF